MASSEMAVPESRSMEIQEAIQGLHEMMLDAGINFEGDSQLTSLRMAFKIMGAGTAEEVLNPEGTIAGKDVANRPFKIMHVTGMPSTLPSGVGFYFLLDVVWTDTGETGVVNTGALNVMVQIARLAQLKELDGTFKIVEAPKREGTANTPLWLAAA